MGKATVTVTADNQSKTYGTADPAFTYHVSGLVGTDALTTQPTCAVSGAHADVGTYTISCSGANAGNNYTISYNSGTLTATSNTGGGTISGNTITGSWIITGDTPPFTATDNHH